MRRAREGREQERNKATAHTYTQTHTHTTWRWILWMDNTYIKTSCGKGDGRGEENDQTKRAMRDEEEEGAQANKTNQPQIDDIHY